MKNDKLQICVIESANEGGLIHFAYQLCTALANEGADVTLIVGTKYELEGLPHNFKVEKLMPLWKGFEKRTEEELSTHFRRMQKKVFWEVRRVLRGVRFVFAWLRLLQYLLRKRPQLVQFSRLSHVIEAVFVRFLKMHGFTLSQVCHEFESRENHSWVNQIMVRLYNQAFLSFSAIFLLARESQERFLHMVPSVDRRNTFVIPHGNSEWLLGIQSPPEVVQLRQRYGFQAEDRVVVFFGLLAPSKGIEDLVEAFALSLKDCSSKLVIAGYPTKQFDLPYINDRIAALNIGDKVRLDLRYIPLEEIGALMDLATVVVYPYHSSTQSGSLQAAYTFGKPVIATNVGGLPEVVDDGQSGFLVPPHDPARLAEKISLLLSDPQRAQEMGRYAYHLSTTRFAWKRVASQMMDVYKNL